MSPEDRAKEEAAHQAFLAKAAEVVATIDAPLGCSIGDRS